MRKLVLDFRNVVPDGDGKVWTAVTERVSVGMVGPGRLGQEPAPQLRRAARCRPALGLRRRRGPRAAYQAAYPATRFTAELDDVLADPEVDAVVLATPVPDAPRAGPAGDGGRQARDGREADGAGPAREARELRDLAADPRPRADGRPPAALPPRRRQAARADRLGRAGRGALRVRQPAEPGRHPRGRERPVEPRGARHLGRAAPARRPPGRGLGARRGVRAPGRRGRRVRLREVRHRPDRPPAPLLARSAQDAQDDRRRLEQDGRVRRHGAGPQDHGLRQGPGRALHGRQSSRTPATSTSPRSSRDGAAADRVPGVPGGGARGPCRARGAGRGAGGGRGAPGDAAIARAGRRDEVLEAARA